MELIPQEHSMGCAVACVAATIGKNYQQALKLFSTQEHAWTRGFYCSEIVEALYATGLSYSYAKFREKKHSAYLKSTGTIVFVERGIEYPHGHFFVRGPRGWMNPWSNYPKILDVRAKFEHALPGNIEYIIFPT